MAQQQTQAQKAASKQTTKNGSGKSGTTKSSAAKAASMKAATTKTPAVKAGLAQPARRTYTRNEKIFYIISLLVVVSMLIGLVAVAITPAGF
jgi:hypothetical protein